MPYSLRKSVMYELWEKEKDNLRQTCLNKFRSMSDFNIWLVRNWKLANEETFFRSAVTRDLPAFKAASDIIIANRYHKELADVMEKCTPGTLGERLINTVNLRNALCNQ